MKNHVKKPNDNNEEESEDSPLSIENLEKMIEESLAAKWTRDAKKYDVDHRHIKALKNIVGEYMSGFIVIGYTHSGTRVIMKNTGNHVEEDALIELLRWTINSLYQTGNEEN